MRADRIPPLTWLLGTVAAWAVLGVLLAWAGMGGRIAAGGAAGAAAQPLPRPVADAKPASPVGYDAFAARPPFAQDRRPHAFTLPGGGDDAARGDAGAFDYVLSSVIITPRLRLAIVEPSSGGEPVRVREGDTAEGLGGWRLVELRPRAAVFEGAAGRRELALRVWAGGDGAVANAAPQTDANDAAATYDPPPPPVSAPPPDAADDPPAPDSAPIDTQRQMEAIRRRIEARRAQLRREAQPSQATPARNP